MKASEIKELTKEELIENLGDTKLSLNKLKINHKIAELENPIEVRAVRRTIARIQTELRMEGEQTLIEIVSEEMLTKNQYGIMAHWSGSPTELADYYRIYLSQLDQMAGDKDVRMLDVMSYVQSDQVQIYSPKGDMLVFPQGATVLDFAYGIHTELGNHCIGALVNPSSVGTTKKRVPRERQLFTGEALQIITDPGVHPKEEWLNQVKTAKSRSQIKRAVEQQKVINARNSGRTLLERKLREKGEELSLDKWIKSTPVKSALKAEKLSANKFFQEIGLQKRPDRKSVV